jgi:hypothetical protein
MSGYINGKVEIFCGDYPPCNLNLLWYKRCVKDNKDYYALYEFNAHKLIWQPINSSLITELLISEDGDFIIGEDGYPIVAE